MSDASDDHMVETYSSMGLIMALYAASISSFCFPRVVDVSALSMCFCVILLLCCLFWLLYVS